MKRIFLKSVICTFSLSFVLSGCSNFFSGSELKKQMDEQITFANQKNPLNIISIYPEYNLSGVYKDSPISITFNKSIDSESFKFKIESNSIDITSCYNSVEYYDDNRTVKISPVYPVEIQGSYSDVSLIILNSLKAKDGTKFSLSDFTYNFRISNQTDPLPPEVFIFNVAKTKEDAKNGTNLLSTKNYLNWTNEADANANHLSELWVYAKAYDKESGCNCVRYSLNKIQNVYGIKYSAAEKPMSYYADFKSIENEDGYSETLFKVDFNALEESENSFENTCDLYSIDFYVLDRNYNSAETISRNFVYDKRAPEIAEIKISSDVDSFSDVDEITGKGKFTFFIHDDVIDRWHYSEEDYDLGKTFVENLTFNIVDKNGNEVEFEKINVPFHIYARPDFYFSLGDNVCSTDYFYEDYISVEEYNSLCENAENKFENFSYSSVKKDDLIIQSGAVKIVLSDISFVDGAMLKLIISDDCGNKNEVPLSIPGTAIYGGLADKYEGPYSVYNGLLLSKKSLNDSELIISNLTFHSDKNRILCSGKENGNYFRLNTETYWADESFIDFCGAQQFYVRQFSENSFITLFGKYCDLDKLFVVEKANDDIPEIINITWDKENSDSAKKSGLLPVHVEFDKKNKLNAYIKVYKNENGTTEFYKAFMDSDFSLPADGKIKYVFSTCYNNMQSLDLVAEAVENFYNNGNEILFTLDDESPIDVVAPLIQESYDFWNDLVNLSVVKNIDDNPLYEEHSGEKYILYESWYHEIPAGYNCFEDFMTENEILENANSSLTLLYESILEGEFLTIPFEKFKLGKRYEIFVKTYDMAGNYSLTTKVIDFETPETTVDSTYGSFSGHSGTKVRYREFFAESTFEGADSSLRGYESKIEASLFDENENRWDVQNEISSASGLDFIYLYFDIDSVIDAKFVKVKYVHSLSETRTADTKVRTYLPDWTKTSYKYLMCFNDWNIDYWTSPDLFSGAAGNKIRLITNQPVLLRTVYSQENFDSDITQWEYYGTKINFDVLGAKPVRDVDFNFGYITEEEFNELKVEKEYYYNVQNVPSGNYYVVIGTAADGTEMISQVYKK